MCRSAQAQHRAPGWRAAYRLRWKRRGLLWRSYKSRRQLTSVADRTGDIRPRDLLVVMTLRNEATRLPHFLSYYRALGVDHFLVVDNGSDDGTDRMLQDQPDVSLWSTHASYNASRFGLDWMTWLQMQYCHDHWTLMVDADELLVFAHHDTRSLKDLTGWLDTQGLTGFGALMLDLYPKGPLGAQDYAPGQDPGGILDWFDAVPYRQVRQQPLGNLWVQGGVRERAFFADIPARSPTLNKIPLIRWSRRYAYVNSTHSLLPRAMNFLYDGPGGTAPSGVLLHTKFLPEIVEKSAIEKQRAQHFTVPQDFDHYYHSLTGAPSLWDENSVQLQGWKQLEALELMNSGGW